MRETVSSFVEQVDTTLDPGDAVRKIGALPGVAVLESSLSSPPWGRYSIFATDPVAEVRVAPGIPNRGRDAIHALASQLRLFPSMPFLPKEIPFAGGWIGYLSYESGLAIERITAVECAGPVAPLVHFRLYDTVAIHDALTRQWHVAACDWPRKLFPDRAPARARLMAAKRLLQDAAFRGKDDAWGPIETTELESSLTPWEYLRLVESVKRYIEAGDVYQVNLTNRFRMRTTATPHQVYVNLRRCNPSPFSAFFPWGDIAVISASPELFLRLRDGHVTSRPIKGTRPRGASSEGNQTLRNALEQSEKDRAELVMIVDLLRNDLGRVCAYGSIRVPQLRVIEAHPTVFQQVATIEGKLMPGATWVELLRAAFPCGSVTGAPKIRAMQIISEIEPVARGVYCGCIGYIGLDGSLDMSVAIRTMVQSGSTIDVHAGGGIVADSDPEEEYAEMLAKSRGMMQAVCVPGVSIDSSVGALEGCVCAPGVR